MMRVPTSARPHHLGVENDIRSGLRWRASICRRVRPVVSESYKPGVLPESLLGDDLTGAPIDELAPYRADWV